MSTLNDACSVVTLCRHAEEAGWVKETGYGCGWEVHDEG